MNMNSMGDQLELHDRIIARLQEIVAERNEQVVVLNAKIERMCNLLAEAVIQLRAEPDDEQISLLKRIRIEFEVTK